MNRLILSVVAALLLLVGCENYDFTVNDRLIYGPSKLFFDFSVADPALDSCLRQGIADGNVDNPRQLRSLNCSDAGISDLTGLAQFPALEQLKFSNNEIRNLVELTQLPQLERIWLDNNRIVDPVPLSQLPLLALIDLSGNPTLQCPKAGVLADVADLKLPKHCLQD